VRVVSVVDTWQVAPFTATHARTVLTWQYPAPYERYSMTSGSTQQLLASGFVALVDAADELVAIRSFGPDGQVPGWDYDGSALDTGGCLRPDLAGRGLGRAALRLGLGYGRTVHSPPAFRMTVWAGNERALRVVRSVGFVDVARFTSTVDGDPYLVLLRREDDGPNG
jgi:RimJ/RimL family protein N-acetyltransferase